MRLRITNIVPLVLIALSLNLSAQNLSRTEKKILKAVSANNDEAIAFLKKVVNMNSGTMNHDGVKAVGAVFGSAFEAIEFETSWIDLKEVNRSGHLFAETRGNTGKNCCLSGISIPCLKLIAPFRNSK